MHVGAQGALATATAAKTSLQRLRFFLKFCRRYSDSREISNVGEFS